MGEGNEGNPATGAGDVTDSRAAAQPPMMRLQEVNPMRSYRWTLVPLPFVALALLVLGLSTLMALPQ